MAEAFSGGCQCGAVRFRALRLLDNSHICHCRMCQKAAGNFFMPLVGVPHEDLAWTRGKPAVFRSSEEIERGFCSHCGTPLFFHNLTGGHVSLTIGAFDQPERVPLKMQCGMEGRLPQIDQLQALQDMGTTEAEDPGNAAAIKASSRQHPDHDTDAWPLA
jgi:hypothetical protein